MGLSGSLTPKWWKSHLFVIQSPPLRHKYFYTEKKDPALSNFIVEIFLLQRLLELEKFPSKRGNPSVGNSNKVQVITCLDTQKENVSWV